MIIKGTSCAGASRLAAHLLRTDHNERVAVIELRGSAAPDLRGALADMEALTTGTPCKRPLYHASINTRADERLTDAQRAAAIDRLEDALGLKGQPRAVVVHLKEGRQHTHCVWARIDAERNRVVSDSFNFRTHEAVARDLERAFGHALVPGAHVGRKKGSERPQRTPDHAEMQQAARSATRPADATAQITALWRSTVTGQAFAAALAESGWTLCRGDRRDFVLMDSAGNVHSLARRVQGARAADIRARMMDVDPATLPAVSEARSAICAASPRSGRRKLGEDGSTPGVRRFPRAPRSSPSRGRASRLADADEVTRRPQPQAGGGLYVTVSRQRLDYARPLLQPGANANAPPSWTPARIAGIGIFRAAARLAATPCDTNATVAMFNRRPATITTAAPGREIGSDAPDELSGLLDAIAAEVNARAGIVCDGIAADFANRIRQARRLPKHLAAAEIAALRQAKKAAVRFVRESAAMEIKGRQKQARVMMRRGKIKLSTAAPKLIIL